MAQPGIFVRLKNAILRQKGKNPEVIVRNAARKIRDVTNLKDTSRLQTFIKCHPTLQMYMDSCINKCVLLGEIFATQCNVIAAQRVRRTVQILNLYSKLYDQKTISRVAMRIGANFMKNGKGRPIYFLFGATLFSWHKDKISDEHLQDCIDDMQHVRLLANQQLQNSNPSAPVDHYMDEWETVILKDHFKVWRKAVPDSCLYEYKVFGTYYDIPARAFFNVQWDLDYRRQWDRLVIKLDKVDEDQDSHSEVVHWVTHYPYPMYSREYVYLRRYKFDMENNMMVMISKATPHPKCPETKKYVRVKTYNSQMVIKPHSTFEENGFDYSITYYDDPQANFPSVAYNWMASTGVPDFVDKLHTAAKTYHSRKPSPRKSEASGSYGQYSDNIPGYS